MYVFLFLLLTYIVVVSYTVPMEVNNMFNSLKKQLNTKLDQWASKRLKTSPLVKPVMPVQGAKEVETYRAVLRTDMFEDEELVEAKLRILAQKLGEDLLEYGAIERFSDTLCEEAPIRTIALQVQVAKSISK